MLLGVDIGGTTINLGLVEKGHIVSSRTVPSFAPTASKAETLTYLSDVIKDTLTPEVERIGIGVPTLVDPEKGIVYQAANIPSWDEVPLKEELEYRFQLPVHVNNDSNCFALGAAARLDRQYPVLVGITLGTGLGMGVVCDGKLWCGTRCGVGELGLAPYLDADYESYCSKKFFVSRGWNGKKASEAADAGNSAAQALIQEFGRHMGELLGLVLFAYDPDCIVLGGGVANCYSQFKDSMMETLRLRYPYALDALRIEVMPEGEIPVLGASLLQ